MKYLVILTMLFMSGVVLAEQKLLQDLGQLVWKNRIILVLSAEDDSSYEAELKRDDAQIKDRDILWFVLEDSRLITNYSGQMSSEFSNTINSRFPTEGTRVLLIGKDGYVKGSAEQLKLGEIFREIDSMPMRQQEMESNSQ